MTPKDKAPDQDITKKIDTKTQTPPAQKQHKHRKHGYRGYPNNPKIGGDIHVGTGFAGVGPVSGASSSGSDILGNRTRKSVEELGEEEEEKS
jgi:hypothetical protein